MTIVKSIGKNTLGGGKKMNVELRTYNRSTHDLSYVWRNTQAAGPLVPFMCEVGLPNDTWDIDLQHHVMTHPTIGPLFGSFKMQADVFVCPIRLYNAMLHNNALNVGLNMKMVKLPQIEVPISKVDTAGPNEDFTQINPSCLLSYLGIKGFANNEGPAASGNGTAILAYYDIFKNFYANKQEKTFPVIGGIRQEIEVYMYTGTITAGTISSTDTTSNIDTSGPQYILIKKIYVKSEAQLNDTYVNTTFNNTNRIYRVDDIKKEGASWKTVTDENGEEYYIIETTDAQKTGTLNAIFLQGDIHIDEFDLEDIDNMRENILSTGRNQYTINKKNPIKFLSKLTTREEGMLIKRSNISPADWNSAVPYTQTLNTLNPQFGLALKTYQSDIFNNWVNTEWIDGENGINAITAVKIDPESNSFQLDTLNLAKKVYDMLNRIAVSDGTYQSWIETVYTNQYIERSETPIYMGGMSAEIEFQQVISNSATEEEPLGTLAGRGVATNAKGGRLTIKIDEPSYIIGIVSLTPRVDYCQGNRFDYYLYTLDDLHKPALDAIGFQDRLAKSLDWRQDNGSNLSIGKQPAWIDYMTNYNRTFGNFALRDNEAFMCLNRFFEYNEDKTGDYTAYIDPTKYNYIFADTELTAMNFWIQIGVGIECRRAISAKVIPNI